MKERTPAYLRDAPSPLLTDPHRVVGEGGRQSTRPAVGARRGGREPVIVLPGVSAQPFRPLPTLGLRLYLWCPGPIRVGRAGFGRRIPPTQTPGASFAVPKGGLHSMDPKDTADRPHGTRSCAGLLCWAGCDSASNEPGAENVTNTPGTRRSRRPAAPGWPWPRRPRRRAIVADPEDHVQARRPQARRIDQGDRQEPRTSAAGLAGPRETGGRNTPSSRPSSASSTRPEAARNRGRS